MSANCHFLYLGLKFALKTKIHKSATEIVKCFRDGSEFLFKVVRYQRLDQPELSPVQSKGTNPQAMVSRVYVDIEDLQLLDLDYLPAPLLLKAPYTHQSALPEPIIQYRKGKNKSGATLCSMTDRAFLFISIRC